MNREKVDQLPLMQVGFIDSICLPIYESFSTLSEKLEPLVNGVRINKKHWLKLASINSKPSTSDAELDEQTENNDDPMIDHLSTSSKSRLASGSSNRNSLISPNASSDNHL